MSHKKVENRHVRFTLEMDGVRSVIDSTFDREIARSAILNEVKSRFSGDNRVSGEARITGGKEGKGYLWGRYLMESKKGEKNKMSAKTAKGNIIKVIGICPDCGMAFNLESFRVKVDNKIYTSYICRGCAIEENAEIVEIEVKRNE